MTFRFKVAYRRLYFSQFRKVMGMSVGGEEANFFLSSSRRPLHHHYNGFGYFCLETTSWGAADPFQKSQVHTGNRGNKPSETH